MDTDTTSSKEAEAANRQEYESPTTETLKNKERSAEESVPETSTTEPADESQSILQSPPRNRRRLKLKRRHFTYGREHELELLRQHLHDVMEIEEHDMPIHGNFKSSTGHTHNTYHSAILIEAPSGTGKTALLDAFLSEIRVQQDQRTEEERKRQETIEHQDKNRRDKKRHSGISSVLSNSSASMSRSAALCWLCRGKFEEHSASEPFGTIQNAVKNMFTQMLQNELDSVATWRRRIKDAVDLDLDLMLEILPDLESLFIEDIGDINNESAEVGSSSGGMSESVTPDSVPSSDDGAVSSNDQMSVASSIDFEAFGNMSDKEYRFERFRLGFRSLFRCISRYRTVVFVLDDMHWIDQDSMSLVRTLLADNKENRAIFDNSSTNFVVHKRRFLFVGATRVATEFSLVADLKAELKDDLTTISLKPLTLHDVANLLSDILQLFDHEKELLELAEIVLAKTGGNPFVITQFLRLLDEKELIYFSDVESRWVWDNSRIEAEATIAENVTEVVAETLGRVDQRRLSALMVAASFGTSYFEVETIVHAMAVLDGGLETASDSPQDPVTRQDDQGEDHLYQSLEDASIDPSQVLRSSRTLRDVLTDAAEDGLVEEIEGGRFRFSHDRIREAAYSMLPEGQGRTEMHLRIGRQLRSWMDQREELGFTSMSEEALVFHAAQQLNLGEALMTDEWERLDLAELNYQAAELAAKKASFYPSIDHLESGIRILDNGGEKAWTDHYQLILKLTVALTRMQYSCGLFKECIQSASKVVANAKQFEEKVPVLHSKILCLLQQERQDEAATMLLEILDYLGINIPRHFLLAHVIHRFVKCKRMLSGFSDDDIMNLPHADAQNLGLSMPFFERLTELAFLGSSPLYMVIMPLYTIPVILEKGHFELSGYAIGVWAWLRAQFGAFDEGMRYGRLSMRIFGSHADEKKEGVRMKFLYWFFIAHWRIPLRKTLDPISRSLRKMWQLSALDYYHMAGYGLLRNQFACGEPLSLLLRGCRKFAENLIDYNFRLHWNINSPIHQAALNFMGCSKDPSILVGDHINIEYRKEVWLKTGNKMALYQSQVFGMIVAYYFQNYELAEQHATDIRQGLYDDGPEILVPLRLLYMGLVYIARFKSTKKRRYKRKLRPIMKQFRKWVDAGAINTSHMYDLLRAELLSVSSSRSVDAVVEAFERAIDSATELDIRQHIALAYELVGSYLVQSKTDASTKARVYLEKSIEWYRIWEAYAKVEDIEIRFKDIFIT